MQKAWNGNALRVAGEVGTEALAHAAESANAVVAVGSCAVNGGWCAAHPNPSNAMGVEQFLAEEGIETPVVTGNTSLRRGTPSGTNFVYNKERNRVLRGADYASPVKFWIPVRGAIGIHDASWRSKDGGEIYKTNGSHGCINTPYDEVSKLYDMVEIGTPCVMFY